LLQNPLETNSFSDLISCRRCGKHIDRKLAVCPYCGHHVMRARRVIGTAWVVAGVVVAGGVGYGVYRSGYLEQLLPDRPAEVAAAPAPEATAPDTVPPLATPIVVPSPDTARTARAPTPPAPQPPVEAAEPPRDIRRSLQTRYTTDWVNVREGRSVTSPVVRVLAPGIPVNVAEMRDGWWEYYESGTMRGYIANSVLESQPPGVSPQPNAPSHGSTIVPP
jgi:ribosomal protein L37E